ncbi:MAG: hypothetical protein AMXMBFR84_43150 [Candidatus Hydrogenedentota bacterium]
MITENLPSANETTLARSALYGVLALALHNPSHPRFCSFSWQEEIDALREAIAFVRGTQSGPLEAAVTALAQAAGKTSHEAIRNAYVRLFGHTARGQVPPYETEYGTGGPFTQPQEMSDIVGFYRAFGLDVDPVKRERLDHISCECEFMCFLCAREVRAVESNDENTAEAVQRAQRLFLRDHLGAFARTFFADLSRQPAAPWHAAIAGLGARFIDAECERFELAISPAYLTLRPIEEVAVPMACGSCDGPCESGDVQNP